MSPSDTDGPDLCRSCPRSGLLITPQGQKLYTCDPRDWNKLPCPARSLPALAVEPEQSERCSRPRSAASPLDPTVFLSWQR